MWRKLLFFAALYFLQGAALAYIINFQKPYLAGRAVGKETIGIFTSLLLLPFIFKIALGWLSDKYPLGRLGRRKPYMLIGLVLFGGCYFALIKVDPGSSFIMFATLTWIASLGLAWFDTCADAWAVDTARSEEESGVQAAMICGKSLGLILMSGAFGALGLRYGFGAIFCALGLLSVLVALLVIFAKYEPTVREAGVIVGLKDLKQSFFLLFAGFGIVYSIASFGTDGLISLFLSETKLMSPFELGFFGMTRGSGALVGAATYVAVHKKLGAQSAQKIALGLLGIGCLLPLAPLSTAALGVGWGFAWGFQETAFVTFAMQMSKGAWAASLFALCMIFSNLGTAIGEALGAPLVSTLGYEGVFTAFAVTGWLSLGFIPVIHRLRKTAN